MARQVMQRSDYATLEEWASIPWPRSQILQIVRCNPGIHPAEVARKLDMNRNTFQYHVQLMLKAGVIRKGEPATMDRGGNRFGLYLPPGK